MRTILRALRRAAFLTAACVLAAPPTAATSIASDFGHITSWLSNELAQEIAFNAGSTFDPPHELTSRHVQPDVSFGVGKMPLDKTRFPTL